MSFEYKLPQVLAILYLIYHLNPRNLENIITIISNLLEKCIIAMISMNLDANITESLINLISKTSYDILHVNGSIDHLFQRLYKYCLDIIGPNRLQSLNTCCIICSSLMKSFARLIASSKMKVMIWFSRWVVLSMQGMSHDHELVRLNSLDSFQSLLAVIPLYQTMYYNNSEIVDRLPFDEDIIVHNILLKSIPTSILKSTSKIDKDIVSYLSTNSPLLSQLNEDVHLRGYQWDGITWMTNIRRCGLGCLLADDMGVGKTAQVLVTLYLNAIEKNFKVKSSLIICPDNLVFHWQCEFSKFLGSKHPHQFSCNIIHEDICIIRGSQHMTTSIYIIGYKLFIEKQALVASELWEYIVLDEVQLIKRPDSTLAKSIYQLNCKHRLAISGTPINNDIDEIWSIFHFLIPGFLKDWNSFHLKTNKRDDNLFNEEAERKLVIESLRKILSPFILRRTKQTVLSDLPLKSIVNLYCDLSNFQRELYNDILKEFKMSDDKLELLLIRSNNSKIDLKVDPIKLYQYFQLLSIHPSLVIPSKHKQYRLRLQQEHFASYKLLKLCQLLLEANVINRDECKNNLLSILYGQDEDDGDVNRNMDVEDDYYSHDVDDEDDNIPIKRLKTFNNDSSIQCLNDIKEEDSIRVVQDLRSKLFHGIQSYESTLDLYDDNIYQKCVVLTQNKVSLDYIHNHCFRKYFPDVGIAQIDSHVRSKDAWDIVQSFNDPNSNLRLLLMTTESSCLGLDLSSAANLMILMEHNMNPFIDQQAIDRVHRYGQLKPVTVFKLFCFNTIETRIDKIQEDVLRLSSGLLEEDKETHVSIASSLYESIADKQNLFLSENTIEVSSLDEFLQSFHYS